MNSEMVEQLRRNGFLKTNEIIKAFNKVDRKLFMAEKYEKYAYIDEPFPIPPFDRNHTISAPHTYAIFYEALELKRGDFFLEIGSGSGYGLALAREIVGSSGKVVGVEINKQTFDFCKKNLEK
ncbi:MAG: protein-L-isoaspartate O-methyltransferase, partial [Spirochaetota bacterium]